MRKLIRKTRVPLFIQRGEHCNFLVMGKQIDTITTDRLNSGEERTWSEIGGPG